MAVIMEPVEMNLRSDPCICTPARLKVEEMATALGFDDKAVGQWGLCVNEALANVIRHAYGNVRGKPILLRARPVDGGMEVTLRDWGNGVDPMAKPPKEHDPFQPGGLGLICLRSLMDEATFEPQADGGVLLRLTKRLPHHS